MTETPAPACAKPDPKTSIRTRLRTWFTAPEIWSEPRPCLRDLWRYAKHGSWAAERGLWRSLGKRYAWASVSTHAVAYLALWAVELPLRGSVSKPRVWSQRRPCLRDVSRYTTSGNGVRRRVYAWAVALPIHALSYSVLWISERPTRLFAAGLLYAVLTQTGIGPLITL